MEKTVRKFLDTILDTATPLIATLNKGADDAQVAEFEREMGVTLPSDVRQLYQTFNGQKKGNNDVFFIDELRFLPLSEIKEAQQQWLQHLEKVPNWQDLKFDEEEAIDMYWDGVIKNQFYNPKWLPFLTDGVRYIFIDLDPDKKGIVGQIGELELSVDSIEDSFMDILNESISEWLESINDDLEENLIYYDPDLHSLVDSFVFDEENVMSNIFAPTPDYVSEGGSNVYNYSEKDQSDFVIPDRSCVYMDEICEHFEKYIGTVDSVFHEILSEYVHIDVHWIKPTAERPYHVLFTTGMSDYPMYLPEGLDDPNSFSHAELMVYLPADWQISDEAFKDNDNYWPVYFLKMIARFPHQYKTWMAEGHTIPNGEYAEPIANTEFGCILLMPPYLSAPEEFLRLETKDGTLINFYTLIPIYPEEMDLKLEEGVDTLLELLDENNITEVIDIHRKNVALE
ncbi:suppressor of fused domain protein [Capnocytophaga leadbetteri]|uniref:suppressor of fused domain protein n=1 Tax=Capnocytophaga leadbetteri TaxID=327575 RepID=UPI0028E64945|nr:suppressor of fused domain protein [Capnocytophaga leadbetteri]